MYCIRKAYLDYGMTKFSFIDIRLMQEKGIAGHASTIVFYIYMIKYNVYLHFGAIRVLFAYM